MIKTLENRDQLKMTALVFGSSARVIRWPVQEAGGQVLSRAFGLFFLPVDPLDRSQGGDEEEESRIPL